MTFIAYAQNNEDVVLFRALAGVSNGFYIDVGANDPVADSVTKAFYDRGWRGINIEPLEGHWTDLERERPEDTNLRCVAGPSEGSIDIWEPPIRGWSTASSKVIEEHKASGVSGVMHSVPMRTLASICKQHALGEIHFLKIDVEGFEKDVLAGMDFKSFRPWIVVVEAVDPTTKKQNFEEWESILTVHAYRFVYEDGLNRFYAAYEHPELIERMKYPPNVFDDFVRLAQVDQARRVEEVEQNIVKKNEQLTILGDKVVNLENQLGDSQILLNFVKTELGEAQQHLGVTTGKLRDTTEQLSEARAQLSDSQAELHFSERQLREARAQLVDTGKQLGDVRAQLGDTEKQLGDTRAQLGYTENQLGDTRIQLGDTVKQLGDMRVQLGNTEKEFSDTLKLFSDAKNQLGDTQKNVVELKGDFSAREAAFDLQSTQLLEINDVHVNTLAELSREKERVAEFAQKAHDWWSEALMLDSELKRVKASWSWRATYPLRVSLGVIMHPVPTLKQLCNHALRLGLRYFATPISKMIGSVLSNRNFSERLNYWLLKNYPALHGHLRTIAIQHGVMAEVAHPVYKTSMAEQSSQYQWPDLGILGIFPRYPSLPEGMALSGHSGDESHWIRFTGHLEGHYSLAIVNRNIVGALQALMPGQVQYVPFHGVPYQTIPTLPKDQDQVLGAALRNEIPKSYNSQIISICHHYPMIADELPSGLKLCIFFWEETSVPPDIVAKINANFAGVIVAAQSVKTALINSGCEKSITVVPLGIDHIIPQNTELVRSVVSEPEVPFRFLHVSSAFHRKGVDVLLEAFLEAFNGDDAVELYIKTFPNPHNQVSELLKTYAAKHQNPARVIIDELPLDDGGMISLYRTAHSVVLPTRGEGFNLPAAEALAMGIPVITTGYSAQADFCTLSTAHLIGFQFASSESHLRTDDSCWVNPNKADLIRLFRSVRDRVLADDPEINSMREFAAKYVRDTYSWGNTAKSIIGFSERMLAELSVPKSIKSIALLTPWSAKCGVAEYSEELFKSVLDNDAMSVKIFSDTRTNKIDPNVFVTWKVGHTESVVRTLKCLQQQVAEIVFVQHQPSLFELNEEICEQLSSLQKTNRGVYLELHSTKPLIAEFRLTPHAVRCLAQLDRIIVHKVEDLNNLLSLGLWQNVVLVNLGVVQPLAKPDVAKVRNSYGIPADALVLGCFGFALPHKGVDEVVGAIPLLAAELGRPVYMLAVCSALDERSAHVIKSCKALSERLGVAKQITWITDYRPITECQELLCSTDYVVYPYRDTQESASGAVTIGLSTLKPVLVSPLNIFSDVRDVSLQMTGSGSADICRKVVEWEAMPTEAKSALLEKQRQWLKMRDWDSVSRRLLTMASQLHQTEGQQKNRNESELLRLSRFDVIDNKRMFVDISELYVRDGKTGIQRVVKNILAELQNNPPAGYAIHPVYGIKGKGFFYATTSDKPSKSVEGTPVYAGVDDIFLGLDLAAHLFPEAEEDLLSFKRAGAKIFYVVYDIIPLRYAAYAFPGIEGAFKNWLVGLNKYADGLMCISHAVAVDVANWFAENGGKNSQLKIDHFPLGADFLPALVDSKKMVPAQFAEISTHAQATLLMVGTLEPRKGHKQVLDALDTLWQQGVQVKLIIVGKVGWNVDELIDCIRTHPENGQRLFWFDRVEDAELDYLYRTASALIAASYAEGFGLPLIEAAHFNLPIISRNIPVFREVAGDHAFYFDAKNGDELALQLKQWLGLFACKEHPLPGNLRALSWRQSTEELVSILKSIMITM